MHGLAKCPQLQKLIQTGDMMIGKVVNQITTSKLWAESGNNAIIIWDEDSNPPYFWMKRIKPSLIITINFSTIIWKLI
ncbi:MAG: hypothetical protein PUP90_26620 [Nostoc sp. S4]|nr:hypothetical protein [Nostoc sp. S4]